MNLKFHFLILCVLAFIAASISSHDVVLRSPSRRSLLSYPPTPDVELIAAPNGTVYFIHSDSRKVVWSFPSGPPIYLSYRAPLHQDEDEKDHTAEHSRHSFLDCGDDWELYLNHNNGRLKLNDTIQDYVKKTPIYEDDEVTVGSMHSTAFKVDPRTGKLIHNYGKSLPTNMPNGGGETLSLEGRKKVESSGTSKVKGLDVELYIERIDYSLSTKAFDKLLWNLTIGSFKAKVRCRGSYLLRDKASLVLEHSLGLRSGFDSVVSLPCEFEFPVHRFRKQSMFDHFLGVEGVPDPQTEQNLPPADVPNHLLPSHEDEKTSATHHRQLRPGVREILEIKISRRRRVEKLSMLIRRFIPWSFILLAMLLIGYAYHRKSSYTRLNGEVNVETNVSTQSLSSRRRRSRKSGRSLTVLEEGQNNGTDIKRWPNLNSFVQGDTNGRTVGKMFVSSREIAKGGNGTVVYEGIYDGRKVAVKRMVQAHHDVAFKEIQHLIASDQHPNIVRWHGVEYDHDFVYVALEHCSCSLNDLIESLTESSQNSVTFDGKAPSAVVEHKVKLNSVKTSMKDIKLRKNNGYPSAQLLKIMRDLVCGLAHLHELGIVHRDIKPQNVLIQNILINGEPALRAKLSDMGISKRLLADMSSLGLHATGHGSSGWQAPEQLLHGRQTRAVDMFSLGCVLFFCVTGGSHPFGERFERDSNIIKNQVDLFLVENIPEAMELLARLLQPDPQLRPKASEVLHHPFFWNSEMRLSFLHDASDRVELEDRESNSDILNALESVAPVAIGTRWNEKMEPDFINNIGHYRRYKYESVRDLLRVLRNKLNHYRELPANIQTLLGSVPDGFDEYFSSRFPKLLIEVYKVVYKYCYSENWFQKYLQYSVI
ncbi:hypothetical protein RND81_06G025700 [Saponaria officinalis]|uniref:non-specific serine/threonine protein kinase n=1 Tax=Saponaria officinalis TaxID=3572 RepID=A0AAW1K6W7_SAPOF